MFQAKRRPFDLAIPLVASDLKQVEVCLGQLSVVGRRLADRFWPGPLTLVINAPPALDPRLLAGHQSVAVRVPDQAVARALAAAIGFPVTSTSANLTGTPTAASASEVVTTLGSYVAFVIDGGQSDHRVPSTIIDVRGETPVLIREGVVAWDRVVQSLA